MDGGESNSESHGDLPCQVVRGSLRPEGPSLHQVPPLLQQASVYLSWSPLAWQQDEVDPTWWSFLQNKRTISYYKL